MLSNLFAFINNLNHARPAKFLSQVEKTLGSWQNKQVAVLGLSFKPNTDDQREAPALAVIPALLQVGAKVKSFDPMVKEIASAAIVSHPAYEQVASIETAVAGADVIMVLIEWQQIVAFDFASSKEAKTQYFLDVRNQFQPAKIQAADYIYIGNGRQVA